MPERFTVNRMGVKELQDIWEQEVLAAFDQDRQAELEAEADRVEDFIESDSRQRQAYEWCCVWGIPQRLVAKKMDITQQAVSRLLSRYFKNHPEHRPRTLNRDLWAQQAPHGRLPAKETDSEERGSTFDIKTNPIKTAGDRDRAEAAVHFNTSGHGYHKPGKTHCPNERIGQAKRKKYKKIHE